MSHTEGWAQSPITRGWHYFRDQKSLCTLITIIGDMSEPFALEMDEHPEACRTCVRLRIQERTDHGPRRVIMDEPPDRPWSEEL